MRLCEFTNPSTWDVVKTDGRDRPIGLSRVIGPHVISLYHDAVSRQWWWSIVLPPSRGGGEVAHGTSDSLPHAMSAVYSSAVENGVIDAHGTTCRPHEADVRGISRTDDG